MLALQILISQISGTMIMFGLVGILSVILYTRNNKKDAYGILFSSFLAVSITTTLKYLLMVPRPLNMLVSETDPRFPSGHATMAAVIMTLVIYYSGKHIENRYYRYFLYGIGVAWFIIVSYSRLYLHVHYPIDVVVGGIIGVSSTLVTIYILNNQKITRFFMKNS